MKNQKLYSVIVLAHNHLETTKRCLDCLFATDLSEAELIIVDNGSTDGTWKFINRLCDRTDGLAILGRRSDVNLGVGEGYNAGFERIRGTFFVTLNNDFLIYEKDWLKKMRSPFIRNARIAQVGIEGTGCWLDNIGVGHPLPHPSLRADYIETCCMMGRTAAVKEVGPLFDPIYKFCYCEDSDLSLRLRSKGWEITHIPLNVEHIGNVTLGDYNYSAATEHLVPNLKIFQQRWGKYLATKSF
jgi:GT2 family glycosyltransferase